MGRILLLGATGQIGAELRSGLTGLAPVMAPSRAEADLGAPGSLASLVEGCRPSIIWNCAAQTNVELAEREPGLAWRLNADAPRALAGAAKAIGAVFCHWSTDYVFDGDSLQPYREDDVTRPINQYGRSKLAGEEAIRLSGCRHLILRTSWVYSARRKNFLRSLLARARQSGVVEVVADQIGAPTPATALADTGVALTRRLLVGNPIADGVYHLTAGGATSWAGFAEAIRGVMGELGRPWVATILPVPAQAYPSPVRRPAYSVLSNDKLATATGLTLPDWRVLLNRFLDSAALAEL